MSNKKTILIAAGLSTFALVVMGGVASSLLGWTTTAQSNVEPISNMTTAQKPLVTETNTTASTSHNLTKISPQHASEIAQKATSTSTTHKAPELVNYSGNAAYEVTLKNGLVYVDASNGSVLGQNFNNSKTIMPQNAQTNRSNDIRSNSQTQSTIVESRANTENNFAAFEKDEYASHSEKELTKHDKHHKHEHEHDDHHENEEKYDG